MHDTFVFDIDCEGYVQRWDEEVRISNKKDLHGQGKMESYYNPFDYDNIIPEFVGLTEKCLNGGNLEVQIKKWLKKWGPLYGSWDFENNTISQFWHEALKFYKIWSFYRAIANNDKKTIENSIGIEKESQTNFIIKFFPEDTSFPAEKWFLEAQELRKKFDFLPDHPGYDFKTTIPMKLDPDRDQFEQIQEHSMFFLFSQVESYTNRANLSWGSMIHTKKENQSNFKIRPVLKTENLIDAIYLQFYILFSENEKKICPICNTPFIPPRKDKIYCSDSCYLTAKSRRYREKGNKKSS